jgi:hypothetical protein
MARLALACVLCLVCIPATLAIADDGLEIAAIKARFDAIQNISARFKSINEYTPPKDKNHAEEATDASPEISHGTLIRGRREYQSEWSYLSGRVAGSSTTSPQTLRAVSTPGVLAVVRDRISLQPGRAERAVWYEGKQLPYGGIKASDLVPEEWTLDLGLGLRMYRAQEYLTRQDLEKGELTIMPDKVVLTLRGVYNSKNAFEFDPKIGFALRRYSVTASDGFIFLTVECDEFKQYANLYLPMRVVRKDIYEDESKVKKVASTYSVHIEEYAVDDPANTPESYLMLWPKGSRISDMRVHFELPVAREDRTWDDAAIADALKAHQREEEAIENEAQERISRVLSGQPSTAPVAKP